MSLEGWLFLVRVSSPLVLLDKPGWCVEQSWSPAMSGCSIQCTDVTNPILPRVTGCLSGGWRKFSCRYWPDQSELRAAAGFVSRQPWRACWEQRRAVEYFPPEYYNISNIREILQILQILHCLLRWLAPRTPGEDLWLGLKGSYRWDISQQMRCLYCRPGGGGWSLLFLWLPPSRTRKQPASRREPEVTICSCGTK